MPRTPVGFGACVRCGISPKHAGESNATDAAEHTVRALWVRPVEAGIGQAPVEIRGVTTSCPVMEGAALGMQAALQPEGRSGIWGRVLEGGRVRSGDSFVLEAMPSTATVKGTAKPSEDSSP